MSDKLISADEVLKRTVLAGEIRNPHMEVVPAYFLREAPAVDAVEVTYCDQCSNHGHCIPEDTFRLAGVEKPFCCVGGRREENETY